MPPNQENDIPIDTGGKQPHYSKQNNVDNDVVVRRDEMERLNDPDCTHKSKDGLTAFIQDSDTIGTMQAWKCTRCQRGTFLPMSVKNIT